MMGQAPIQTEVGFATICVSGKTILPSKSGFFQTSIFGAPTRLELTTHADLMMVISHVGQYNQRSAYLVRTLNDHLKSEQEPPDLKPSSNVDGSQSPSGIDIVIHLGLM
jgi:hypothetical protein